VHEERLELSRLAAPEPKANADGLACAETARNTPNGETAQLLPEHHNGAACDSLAVPTEVDHALAFALTEATKAGRWDVVAQLARELEARRLAGSNVVTLDTRRQGGAGR
jgi:hypothetical protein